MNKGERLKQNAGYEDGRRPVYWKNGELHVLSAETEEYGELSSIALAGDNVYVGGYTRSGNVSGTFHARYWKNDQVVTLPGQNLRANGSVSDIVIVEE